MGEAREFPRQTFPRLQKDDGASFADRVSWELMPTPPM